MQHHRINSLRQYLLLIRLPNAFTAPSNILAGYFATVPLADANGFHLVPLMISSGLLYIAGIALNDYFDVETDRRERPSRPLASGSISKNRAMMIAVTTLAAANALALVASPVSLAVSLALTAAIIAYDSRLKRGPAGPFAMAATRFLNVILGASPAMSLALSGGSVDLRTATLAATLLFAHVVAIMILSRKEVGGEKPNAHAAFSIVFAVIASMIAAGFLPLFKLEFLANLAIFAAVMVVTFRRLVASQDVQQAVKNMVLSIIILDSVFVSGTAGLPYGLATLLLIAPAILLAKKLYVT